MTEARKDFLKTLADYSKYLYEEEVNRAERYHSAMKTYLVFIGSTFTATLGLAKWLGIAPANFHQMSSNPIGIMLGIFVIVALTCFVASFMFTILVIKVWRTERLCYPKIFALEVSTESSETVLMEKIISNYVVAAERNGVVNDKKGKHLAIASVSYRIGLCAFLFAAICYWFI
jgi:hypothetical protein